MCNTYLSWITIFEIFIVGSQTVLIMSYYCFCSDPRCKLDSLNAHVSDRKDCLQNWELLMKNINCFYQVSCLQNTTWITDSWECQFGLSKVMMVVLNNSNFLIVFTYGMPYFREFSLESHLALFKWFRKLWKLCCSLQLVKVVCLAVLIFCVEMSYRYWQFVRQLYSV